MLHLQRKIKDGKIKEENDQVIFIQVAFFAVGAVLLLWYLAPWVLNHILNAGNVLGIAFAVMLLLCGVFVQPVTHLLAPGNHAPGAVVLKAAVALVCAVAVLTSGYMLTGLIQTGHRDETVLVLGCSVKGERPSRMLRQRIEAATEYLEKNPDSKAVLSGGQGPDEKISEAECMRRELVRRGGECGFFGQNYRTKRTEPPCDGGDFGFPLPPGHAAVSAGGSDRQLHTGGHRCVPAGHLLDAGDAGGGQDRFAHLTQRRDFC
jgi:hypothetical protein